MVEGLDRLRRKLTRTIPQNVQRRTREAMAASAREITNMMEALAPQDTGRLAGSIGWTWGDAPKGSLVLARSPKTDDGMRITIYAGDRDAFYARFVEFGTVNVRPHPFFYPSWRANRIRARRRINTAMRRAIRQGASS